MSVGSVFTVCDMDYEVVCATSKSHKFGDVEIVLEEPKYFVRNLDTGNTACFSSDELKMFYLNK